MVWYMRVIKSIFIFIPFFLLSSCSSSEEKEAASDIQLQIGDVNAQVDNAQRSLLESETGVRITAFYRFQSNEAAGRQLISNQNLVEVPPIEPTCHVVMKMNPNSPSWWNPDELQGQSCYINSSGSYVLLDKDMKLYYMLVNST